MKKTNFHQSLRFRLLLASVIIEFVMLTILVANSARLIHNSLNKQGLARVEEIKPLLNAALSGPLAQRDYGTLQEIINEIQSSAGIAYVAIFDNSNKLIASNGWNGRNLPPELDSDLNADDGYFDTQVDISIAGQKYGVLRYGLSTQFLTSAQAELLQQSLLIASAEIGLSILLLALIGYWLTRHLLLVIRASEQIALGNFEVQLPVNTKDEIGQLSLAFNTMSVAINNRIKALSESEANFHAIADYTYGWESWLGIDGNLLWLNPSVERITGYTLGECMKMSDFPSCLAVPEDTERVHLACKDALQGHSRGEYFEFQLRRKNNLVIWIVVFWQPIYGADGSPQ